jgi:3-isopropylmalate dehydrogenase
MRPFRTVDGRAVPLLRDNVDTEVLIRIDRLIDNPPDALGEYLFESWREDADGCPDPAFELNDERYAGAEILVAGENFGCGSSREHAVWALAAYGFRSVIAPSFGDIFRQNCFQNGVLPIELAATEVERIAGEIESADEPRVRIDLTASVVVTPTGREVAFTIDPERRDALLEGLDDIGLTLKYDDQLAEFERHDVQLRPWNYRTSEEVRTMRLLVLGGDGVGSEVVAEVRRIIDWFVKHRGLDVEVREELFGIAAWRAHGTLMRDETWTQIVAADAIIFGAIGAPAYGEIPAEHRQVDWLLEMRRTLDLYENLRPVRALDPLLGASTLRPEIVRGVDMVIVRELAGGIYFSEPRGVESLPDGSERAVNTTAYTTSEVQRIARAAFELARTRTGRVCSVDKANVLEFGAFWRTTVQAVRDDEYPDVELSHMYVDNCAMQLVREPRQFDVIVTENLFGDILSDCAAMVTGSLGMLPSASLGPVRADGRRAALYEPVHGSAPDIAGRGIANPLGAISSFGMCLRHTMHAPQEATLLEQAVVQALDHGARTRDLVFGGDEPALTTAAMGDAVIAELDALTSANTRRS